MDNVTHSLFGLAMARAGLGRGKPWAAPLLIVAANAPDFELIVPTGSNAGYMLHHRGFCHGIVGFVIEAAVLTLVTIGIVHWRKIATAAQPAHVFGVALLGVTSHILLDWLNTYGVRPWQPFNETVYYGDVAFVIDPWFWMLLWGGCFLSAPETRYTAAIYGALGSLMAIALVAGISIGLPSGILVIWLLLAAVVVALRLLTYSGTTLPKLRARAGRWTLPAVALYLCLLLGCSRTALHLARTLAPDVNVDAFSTHPFPGVPWRFTVLADRDARVDRYEVNVLRGQITPGEPFITHRDDPAIATISDTLEYRAWMYFARHRVENRDGDTILLGDARFRIWNRPDWSEMRVKPKSHL